MKKFYSFLICCCGLLITNCLAQTTIILQPNESTSQDAVIWDYMPSTNYGTHPDFTAGAWTDGGTPTITRGLVNFDLSSIPANATINSATLSLYYHHSTSTTGHSTMSGSNACWLKRITSSWSESTVTWNNQPTTTTQNEVALPMSANDTIDYPNINVTNLISDIYNNPSTSYGMMLLLQTEQYYRSLLFASSGEANAAKRPKLSVTYTINAPTNDTCVTFRYTQDLGHDATIWDYAPTTNYGTHPDFTGCAWTWSGTPTISRGLINFNLSSIPSNATITSAKLNLYWYPSTSTTGHSIMNGSNECQLRRITSAWTDMAVTWNTQPTTTTQNEVILPASTNDTMNYPNIDVTNLIKDIYNNPTTSYGMMIMLTTESYYRSLLFGSSNCPDQTKVPILEVCYHTDASVPEIKISNINSLEVYPNPAQDAISINYNLTGNSNISVEFYSVSGKLIDKINSGIQTNGKHNTYYNLNKDLFPAGIYYIKLSSNKTISTIKFVKIS